MVHLRKQLFQWKSFSSRVPMVTGLFQTGFPPPPTLIPCQESPFTCHSSHPIFGSPPQENNLHSQFIKKTEWFLLSCWKLYDVESVTWKQISKSDPSLRGMQKAQQEKYSIKLNTSFLLIFRFVVIILDVISVLMEK